MKAKRHDSADWSRYFVYCPETGRLIWKERSMDEFGSEQQWRAWNARHAGKIAGTPHMNGLIRKGIKVRLHSVGYFAHRIAWEMMYGDLGHEDFVYHVNGNPFDNRSCNLSLVRMKRTKEPPVYHGVSSL